MVEERHATSANKIAKKVFMVCYCCVVGIGIVEWRLFVNLRSDALRFKESGMQMHAIGQWKKHVKKHVRLRTPFPRFSPAPDENNF